MDSRIEMQGRASASELIERYGPQIYGYLRASHGSSAADEIFGIFTESVARSFATEGEHEKFRQQASLRTWAYALARTATLRYLRAEARQRALFTPMDNHPSVLERERHTGSSSALAGRAESLRAALTAEERELLILRVDRGFRFRAIASILEPHASEAELSKAEARLRKRFEAVRRRLRAMAESS